MKKLIENDIGSIAPLIKFFLVIIIWGVLYSVFHVIMSSVMDVSTNMNLLMWRFWVVSLIVVLIVDISRLFMTAQKTQFYYGGGSGL